MPWLEIILFTVFFGFPMVISAIIGHAKGRRWYWFALFGLFSFLGMLIALAQRPQTTQQQLSDTDRAQADAIKLFWGKAPGSYHSVGCVEVTIKKTDAAENEMSTLLAGPTIQLAEAAVALRMKAHLMGANAIENVEYRRTKSNFWSLTPFQALHATGHAICLDSDTYAQVASDPEELWHGSDMSDPMLQTSRQSFNHSMLALVFGVVMILVSIDYFHKVSMNKLLIHEIISIATCGFILLQNFLLLKRRQPRTILFIGLAFMALGIMDCIAGIYIGASMIVFGLWFIVMYPQILSKISQYQQSHAILEQRVAELRLQHGGRAQVDSTIPD